MFSPPPKFSEYKLPVLVVEDDLLTQSLIEKTLNESGIPTLVAASVAAAMSAVEKERPSILITDINLPDGEGVQILRAMRNFGTAVGIAITGFDAQNDGNAHFPDFNLVLTKPFNVDELPTILESLIIKT